MLGPGAQEGSPLALLLARELSKGRLFPNGKYTRYMDQTNAALRRLQGLLDPVLRAFGGSGKISKAVVHQYCRQVRS